MTNAEFAAATQTGPAGFIPIGEATFAHSSSHDGQVPVALRRASMRADDFEITRSISQVQFDNWFAEDGAELISSNIIDMTAVGAGTVGR